MKQYRFSEERRVWTKAWMGGGRKGWRGGASICSWIWRCSVAVTEGGWGMYDVGGGGMKGVGEVWRVWLTEHTQAGGRARLPKCPLVSIWPGAHSVYVLKARAEGKLFLMVSIKVWEGVARRLRWIIFCPYFSLMTPENVISFPCAGLPKIVEFHIPDSPPSIGCSWCSLN